MLDPHDVRSIQVFHLNHIGDMVFSLPLLASLRVAFPNARIVSILRSPVQDICRNSGLSHEFLLRPKRQGWRRRLELAHALRRRQPDLSFLLAQGYEPMLLAWLSRSRRRVGYTGTALGWLLTDRVPWRGVPTTANALRLLERIGVEPAKRDYVGLLSAPAGESRRMAARLDAAGIPAYKRLIVLGPQASARGSIKEWTPEGFAAVAGHFTSQPDTAVALVGTGPASTIPALARLPILDLTGKTNLAELAAVLDRADLFIGIDSGVLHMAAALGGRVVGLYGPTDPAVTGPQGIGHRILRNPVPCSPCSFKACPIGHDCLKGLAADQVIAAAEAALAEAEQDASRMLSQEMRAEP